MARSLGGAEELSADDLDASRLYPLYSSWAWNYGETPSFDVQMEKRFPWGEVQLLLKLEHGIVQGAAVYTDAMDADLAIRVQNALVGAEYGRALPDRLEAFPDIRSWLHQELPL